MQKPLPCGLLDKGSDREGEVGKKSAGMDIRGAQLVLKGNVNENERQDVRCVEAENIKVQHVNDPFRLALQFNFGIFSRFFRFCVYPHTCKSASKQESESNLAKVTLSCTLNNFLSTASWHSA